MTNNPRPIRDGVIAAVIAGVILKMLPSLSDAAVPAVSALSRQLQAILFAQLTVPAWTLLLASILAVTVVRYRRSGRVNKELAPPVVTPASVSPSPQPSPAPQALRRWLRESPLEIIKHVAAAPPRSRDAVAKEVYVGSWLRVEGDLSSIRFDKDGVFLIVKVPKGARIHPDTVSVFVECAAALADDYAHLREDDVIEVEGEISKVGRFDLRVIQGRVLSLNGSPMTSAT